MEFPDLGQHCSNSACKQLDFLPVKCNACSQIFCKEHFSYDKHNCPEAYKRDNQVPVCPLCNTPVVVKKGEALDTVVGRHIDNDCQSDTAKSKRSRIYTNRCNVKGCKQKELIPVTCDKCRLNFCLRHRFETDHDCQGTMSTTGMAALQRANKAAASRGSQAASSSSQQAHKPQQKKPQQSMLSFVGQDLDRERRERSQQTHGHQRTSIQDVQPGMSEDEAMARALAASMQTSTIQPSKGGKTLVEEEQERRDAELARQLQAEEQQSASGNQNARGSTRPQQQPRQKEKSCSVS